MTKMCDFFKRISHESAYQTKTYQYKTVVGNKKVRLYRISRYALTRNNNLIDWIKHSQFWDLCFERDIIPEDKKLSQLTINDKKSLEF